GNAAMIATLVIFGTRLRQEDLAIALSWGTVIGSAAQFGIQLPFVFRYASHLSFGLDRFLEPVREIFRNLGPVVVGRGVVQLSAYVDQMIASYLPEGAVSSLAYADHLSAADQPFRDVGGRGGASADVARNRRSGRCAC